MQPTRTQRLIALLMVVALSLPLAYTAAQEDEAEARELIAQAFEQLASASYTYTLTLDSTTAITDVDGEVYGSQQIYEIEGQVDGADYQDTVALTAIPLENEADAQTTMLERVQIGDSFYVRLDALFAEQVGVEPGWWLLDDLLDTIGDDSVRRISAEQLANVATPSSLVFDVEMIRSLTEADADDIDGVPVRVFDLEMKAVAMALRQIEGSYSERLSTYLRDLPMLLQSEFSLSVRLWIGEADGRLVRSETQMRTYLPYLAVDLASAPDVNIETTTETHFVVTDGDAMVDIEAPSPLNQAAA